VKIVDCTQGSVEWLEARRGKPTASRFGDIVTPTGKPTANAARRRYALELAGERITGRTTDRPVTYAMQRGLELEAKARAWYEFASGQAVSRVGFILENFGRAGCSPDGITATGGVEIKCPMLPHLLEILADGFTPPPDWYMQMQGCMWVCRRSHWDWVLYSDFHGIEPRWKRIESDAAIMEALDEHVPAFCREVDELTQRIRDAL